MGLKGLQNSNILANQLVNMKSNSYVESNCVSNNTVYGHLKMCKNLTFFVGKVGKSTSFRIKERKDNLWPTPEGIETV